MFVEVLAHTLPNYAINLNALDRAVEHILRKTKNGDQYNLNLKDKQYKL